MSSLHSLHNLKFSRIWSKFLKTAHKIKVLVQRKTGNRPVMEATRREAFWTACRDKDANPFKFWFSWPGGTHVQTGAGQEVSALQNAVASCPTPCCWDTFPQPCCSSQVRVEATPHHLMEKRHRAKLLSILCMQNLLLRVTTTKVIWREKWDFLADYSLKINCSVPFVIHSGFEAASE